MSRVEFEQGFVKDLEKEECNSKVIENKRKVKSEFI